MVNTQAKLYLGVPYDVATSLHSADTTANSTGIPPAEPEPLTLKIVKGFFMVLIMVIAIVGNAIVIAAVIRVRRLRRIANLFIASLAVADLLVAMFAMPFNTMLSLSDGKWLPKSFVLCNLFNASDVMFSTASILHLCCISVDRYMAVCDPLRYQSRMTKTKALLMLSGVWVASAIMSHLPIHTGWYTSESNLRYMQDDKEACRFCVTKQYAAVSSTISFWIPLIVMVFTYLRIFYEANRQEKLIHAAAEVGRRAASTPNIEGGLTRPQHLRLQALRSQHASAEKLESNGNDSSTTSETGNEEPKSPARLGDNLAGPRRGSFFANFRRGSFFTNQRKRFQRENKAAKTLGVVMGCFILCWLPFFLWYLVDTFMDTCENPTGPSGTAGITLFWIGYANSSLNPIIYAFMNKEFRTAFKRILKIEKRPNFLLSMQDSDFESMTRNYTTNHRPRLSVTVEMFEVEGNANRKEEV